MTLRIIHITDLHIGTKFAEYKPPLIGGFSAVPISTMRELARAAGRRRVMRTASPCCCIVSGDLTAFGGAQEFLNAETFISESFIQQGTQVGLHYGSLAQPGTWDGVLGNHDIWGGRTSFVAWYAATAKKRKAESSVDWPSGVRTARFDLGSGATDHIDIGTVRVRFYLIDSTLPGWRNVFARGRVSVTDLRALEEQVQADEWHDRYSENGIKKVLRIAVMHHPPSRRWDGGILTSMVLENGPEVCRVLQRNHFGLVLCGHDHTFSYDGLASDLYEVNSGSALQVVRGAAINCFASIDIYNPAFYPAPRDDQVYVDVAKYEALYDTYARISSAFEITTQWTNPVRVRKIM